MVWYQKFEYAISHWLQKATEHVLGCVLCSPGCFSLFRGSALIHKNGADKSVLETYTKVAAEAKHYVQYDQGMLMTYLQCRGWDTLSAPLVFIGVRVTRSLVLCVCFVNSYLSVCPFFFWSLCRLFFFDLWILIVSLVYSVDQHY